MSKRIFALGLLAVAISGTASAEDWTYSGTIDMCNTGICDLVPIADGDPVVGSLTINAGPNATFNLDTDPNGGGGLLDLVDFDFLVGGVIPVTPVICTDPQDPATCSGVILQGTGTTGPDGKFTSGVVNGAFVGGTLGGLLGTVSIDLVAGTMLVQVGGGSVHVADVLASPGFELVPEWSYAGTIDMCNTDICSLVPIADGDPVVGSLTINAGPNATFNLDTDPNGGGGLLDLVNFDFLVGGVIPVTPVICTDPLDPATCSGVILMGSGTTGADGEFTSGVVNGAFVGGTLGGLLGTVSIDLVAGTMVVTVGGGSVHVADVLATPGFALVHPPGADADGDGVDDAVDNCTNVANADQTDTDTDGHGNRCDADFNNTCGTVNFLDVLIMRAGFFTLDPLLNLDGIAGPTNFGDLAIMQSLFLLPPGPSAPGALCNSTS